MVRGGVMTPHGGLAQPAAPTPKRARCASPADRTVIGLRTGSAGWP